MKYNKRKGHFICKIRRRGVKSIMRGKNKYYSSNEEKAAREARAAYMRKWRAANKDRVKAINQNYWIRRAAREALQAQQPAAEQ